MERESNQMQQMCRAGCGFYGNPATEGLCSVCYKESLRKKQQLVQQVCSPQRPLSSPQATETYGPPNLTISNTVIPKTQDFIQASDEVKDKTNKIDGASKESNENLPTSANTPGPSSSNDDKDTSSIESKSSRKKKNRCLTCRKNVGLTGFQCRCGGIYCPLHRYSDKHNCTFDYKEHGAQEIRRNNPPVIGEKIKKI